MREHTPGPWHAFPTTTESGYTGYWYIGRKNNPPQPTQPIEATTMNQHLIETAPRLKSTLEAVMEVVNEAAPELFDETDIRDIMAVIAQANGR